jgi:hypothetical protein
MIVGFELTVFNAALETVEISHSFKTQNLASKLIIIVGWTSLPIKKYLKVK